MTATVEVLTSQGKSILKTENSEFVIGQSLKSDLRILLPSIDKKHLVLKFNESRFKCSEGKDVAIRRIISENSKNEQQNVYPVNETEKALKVTKLDPQLASEFLKDTQRPEIVREGEFRIGDVFDIRGILLKITNIEKKDNLQTYDLSNDSKFSVRDDLATKGLKDIKSINSVSDDRSIVPDKNLDPFALTKRQRIDKNSLNESVAESAMNEVKNELEKIDMQPPVEKKDNAHFVTESMVSEIVEKKIDEHLAAKELAEQKTANQVTNIDKKDIESANTANVLSTDDKLDGVTRPDTNDTPVEPVEEPKPEEEHPAILEDVKKPVITEENQHGASDCDPEQINNTEDIEKKGEVADEKLSEATDDEKQAEATDDEKLSEIVTDKKQPETATDEKQPETVTDEKLAEEVTDEKLAEEVTDEKLAEEATDEKLAEEVTDEKLAEAVVDEKPSEAVDGKKPEAKDENIDVEVKNENIVTKTASQVKKGAKKTVKPGKLKKQEVSSENSDVKDEFSERKEEVASLPKKTTQKPAVKKTTKKVPAKKIEQKTVKKTKPVEKKKSVRKKVDSDSSSSSDAPKKAVESVKRKKKN